MNDPYPPTLAEIDDQALGFAPADPQLKVLTRIAVALEQIVLNQMDRPQPFQNAPQRPANLAALPPMTQVDQKPPCPFHGLEKVRPSTNGAGGFFCSAKGGNGPVNAKGYCTWHS